MSSPRTRGPMNTSLTMGQNPMHIEGSGVMGPRLRGDDNTRNEEATMTTRIFAYTAFAGALLAGNSMAGAADVTFERLRNPEPRNWLMNHGDYSAHRYSALERINKSNVK